MSISFHAHFVHETVAVKRLNAIDQRGDQTECIMKRKRTPGNVLALLILQVAPFLLPYCTAGAIQKYTTGTVVNLDPCGAHQMQRKKRRNKKSQARS
jgi:hypothetical protein